MGKPRQAQAFVLEGEAAGEENTGELKVESGTDHAGRPLTRKSTTGGLMEVGKHVLDAWSLLQIPVAVSSGESEH